MGYGGGIYDHYGMHEKMKEMEERENELEAAGNKRYF